MAILDILAKLGILRFGAKAGTYKNGTERPVEFMAGEIYDADRDLVAGTKPDADDPPPAHQRGPKPRA